MCALLLSRRNLLLIASNEKEREEWINAINEAIPRAKNTKTIIAPRSPKLQRKLIEVVASPNACDNGTLLVSACGAAADNIQNTQLTSAIMHEKEGGSEMEEALKATQESDAVGMQLPVDCAQHDTTAVPLDLQDVGLSSNCGNVRIAPPVVMIRAASVEVNGACTDETGSDDVSSASNLDYGGRETPTPLSQEEFTPLECNRSHFGTAQLTLSVESLLDSDNCSDCSRSESGDDCLDDNDLIGAELDEHQDVPENWCCKLVDRTCQWSPDPMGNDTLCGESHTSCPPGECTSCQSSDHTSCGTDKTLGDESQCCDNICKLKGTACMQREASCQKRPSALNDSGRLGSSNDFSSVSSRLNDFVSSALTDSAVFDDDNTENTFTHGNIVETKTRSNTSTMVIKTSFDEPPSSAAESSLASSAIDTTTACTCGEFRNT